MLQVIETVRAEDGFVEIVTVMGMLAPHATEEGRLTDRVPPVSPSS